MPAKWTEIPKDNRRWEVDMSRPFGEGGFGTVYRGKDKGETGEDPPRDCAAKKVMLEDRKDRENFDTEVEMLSSVGVHKSIIQMYGHERPVDNSGWMFLEMATGGELFERLIDSGSLSECVCRPKCPGLPASQSLCSRESAFAFCPNEYQCRGDLVAGAAWPFITSIAEAIAHCHSKGIIHRDLKLENVMLVADDPHAVKLIDFGLAIRLPVRICSTGAPRAASRANATRVV